MVTKMVNLNSRLSLLTILGLVGTLVACGKGDFQGHETPVDGLIPTIYYIPVIKPEDSKSHCTTQVAPMNTSDKGEKTSLCVSDIKNCRMQGSCVIVGSSGANIFQYRSGSGAQSVFSKGSLSKCPFGMGVKNICLDPYFSIAADPKYFSPGDVLFIDQLYGIVLPSGEIHSGYVIVRDQGGSIKGTERFDFFIGFDDPDDATHIFVHMGFGDPKTRLSFRKISDDMANQVRLSRAYPDIPDGVKAIGKAKAF